MTVNTLIHFRSEGQQESFFIQVACSQCQVCTPASQCWLWQGECLVTVLELATYTVQQKWSGPKFRKSRSGSYVTYSCHHESFVVVLCLSMRDVSLSYVLCSTPCIVIRILNKTNKMHTYRILLFHFPHLHVSVPLHHLHGAFLLQSTLVSKCASPMYKYLQ